MASFLHKAMKLLWTTLKILSWYCMVGFLLFLIESTPYTFIVWTCECLSPVSTVESIVGLERYEGSKWWQNLYRKDQISLIQTKAGSDSDGAVMRTLTDEENVKMLWDCNHRPACQQCCDMWPQLFPWVMWPPLFLSGLMQLSVKISRNINPFLKRQNTSFWPEKHMVMCFSISLIMI